VGLLRNKKLTPTSKVPVYLFTTPKWVLQAKRHYFGGTCQKFKEYNPSTSELCPNCGYDLHLKKNDEAKARFEQIKSDNLLLILPPLEAIGTL
jgi:ssDNA-binding Zn-finger/Zn-ribbon topoisomerase 1